MIIKDKGTEALSAGVIRTMDVGISDNPEDQLMILNILTDTLYTDKISAIWREYGCNGSDANVEAGRGDKPIEITLPTATNPSAVIRDFGFGMSEDQVANTFCKAGASTKRGSNEMIGCLGIGSKAGYAYGPAFTVTTFNGGKKTVYNCFKDNGMPRMAKLHQEDTSEPDGVEISVPVRRPDIPDFIERAERVYRYFKVRPIIKGGKIEFKNRDAQVNGTGWSFTASEHSIAIMGNVGYDLDARMLPGDFPPKKKMLVEAGIELYFPIGALEMSANREGLQYKDTTLKAISHALGIAMNEIGDTFTKQIAGAKTYWEAKKMYGNVFEKTGGYGMRQMRNTLDDKVTWNGIPLKSGQFSVQVPEDKSGKPSIEGVRILQYSQRSYYTRGKRLNKYENPYDIPARDTTVLVVNDNKSGAISAGKIRYHFEMNTTIDNIVVFTFATPKAKAAYIKAVHLEGAPMLSMTAMAKPPIIPGAAGGPSQHRAKHQARLLEFDETKERYTYPKSAYWTPVLADKDGDAIYTLISAYEPEGKYVDVSCDTMRHMLKAARALGYISATDKVIGVKQKTNDQGNTVPITKLGAKWKTLDQVFAAAVKKQFAADPALPQVLADFIQTVNYTPFMDAGVRDKMVAGCPARAFLDEYVRMRDGKKIKALYEFYTFVPKLFTDVTLPNPATELTKKEKDIWNRYPMLKFAEYNMRHAVTSSKELQKGIDYINMVELISASRNNQTKPQV